MKHIKKIYLISFASLCLMFGHNVETVAQNGTGVSTASLTGTEVQNIDWSKYARSVDRLVEDNTSFYIFDTSLKQFVSTGGQYGVQPIAAASGMLFSIDTESNSEGTVYRLKSNVINGEDGTGDCVGVKPEFDANDIVDNDNYVVYIDRSESDPVVWTFKKVGGTDQNPMYTLCSSRGGSSEGAVADYFLSYYKSSETRKRFYVENADESKAAKFYFIEAKDYNSVILNDMKEYIDVSNLIRDARFERMNKDAGQHVGGYWDDEAKKWVEDDWEGGAWKFSKPGWLSEVVADGKKDYLRLHDYFINDTRYIRDDVMAYGTAWIGKVNTEQKFSQTVTGVPAGYYRVNCQGFYKGEGLGEAYLFANGREVRLQKLSAADEAQFGEIEIQHSDDESQRNLFVEDMFRAGKLLAGEDPYADGTAYDNSVYVKVENTNGDGTGDIELGFVKRGNAGDAYVDNFKLYYCGNREWYLNAANTSAEGGWSPASPDEKLNKTAFGYPVRYNLRRKFAVKAWNSFVVPFNIEGAQVKNAFSGSTEATQVKVSRFDRVNELSDHIQIVFKKVDLDNEGIEAGVPYIVWVGNEPDVKDKTQSYTFEYGNNQSATVYGPLYHIDGVVPVAYDNAAPTTTEGSVTFHGFYYKPEAGAPAGSYILSGGDMYHLTSNYTGNSFVGTCWYMTLDGETGAKKLGFCFEEDSTPTAISVVETGGSAANARAGYVYNLEGQRVATDGMAANLKPGVYVCGGRKVVVR